MATSEAANGTAAKFMGSADSVASTKKRVKVSLHESQNVTHVLNKDAKTLAADAAAEAARVPSAMELLDLDTPASTGAASAPSLMDYLKAQKQSARAAGASEAESASAALTAAATGQVGFVQDYRRTHGSVVIDDETNRILTALMAHDSERAGKETMPSVDFFAAAGALLPLALASTAARHTVTLIWHVPRCTSATLYEICLPLPHDACAQEVRSAFACVRSQPL